jgi:hypothetical protein
MARAKNVPTNKQRLYTKRNAAKIQDMVREVALHKAKGITSYLAEETLRQLETNIKSSIYGKPNRGGYERSNEFAKTPKRTAAMKTSTNTFKAEIFFDDSEFTSSTSGRWYQHASMWGSDNWGYEPKDAVALDDFVIWMERGYNFKKKNGTRMKRPAGKFIEKTEKWLASRQSQLATRILAQKTLSFLERSDVSINSNLDASISGTSNRKSYGSEDEYEE